MGQPKCRKQLFSSKRKHFRAILSEFSPHRYEVNEKTVSQRKISKNDPFVNKAFLESNFKGFHKSAIPENFNLKREKQMKSSVP